MRRCSHLLSFIKRKDYDDDDEDYDDDDEL